MENYIVRIYRRDEQNPDDVIGMVERVEWDDRQPFHGLSELCEILSLRPAGATRTEMHISRKPSASVTPIAKNLRHR